MKFTLRQLQVFLAIAETGNITTAAAKIHLTQSAASMALKDLESALDAQLFLRERRKKMHLTPAGTQLQPLALQLLQDSQKIENLASLKQELQGDVRIGASTTIGNFVLPKLLSEFTRAHPSVHLELGLANTSEIVAGLKSWQYDLALVEGHVYDEALIIKPWLEDELLIFTNQKHALAKRKNITLSDLEKRQWVLREVGSGTRQLVDGLLQQLSSVSVPITSNSAEAIKTIVKNNANYMSCLSRYVLENNLQDKTLQILSCNALNLKRSFYLLSLKKRPQSQATEAMMQFLQTLPQSTLRQHLET